MSAASRNTNLAIVPALNEAGAIARVVERIHAATPDFDVLVVDDGSTDDTATAAEAAGAITLRHPFNLGIGGAVQSGYLYALANGYEMAVQIDGDGQHPPEELPKLVERLLADPPVDLVYGSRFLGEGDYAQSLPRRLGGLVFSTMLSLITRRRVTDPTSGFRLANRRAIALFAHDYPHDYPEVEAILMMHRHQLTTAEVPVTMHLRDTGASSITWMHSGYYMVKVMLAVFVGLFRARSVMPIEEGPAGAGRVS
ncbi:MAG: glycosyltransferase family 2 protein [Actinobacteria bacterium]|nr:glycosyltransferase family 2 protein [Actinomycetota bacterium]